MVGATKFLVSFTKFLVSTTNFKSADQKFGSPNRKFHCTDQKFGCLNPHHFLAGVTKNEGQSYKKFWSTQLNRYLVVPTLTKGWKCLKNSYECDKFDCHQRRFYNIPIVAISYFSSQARYEDVTLQSVKFIDYWIQVPRNFPN